MQLEITGWRESKGRGRVITQYMGKRVFSAVLDELMANVKVLQTRVDPDSHQEWQQVSVTARPPIRLYQHACAYLGVLRSNAAIHL